MRRAVRAAYLAALPTLSRSLARLPGGGPVALPPRLTVRYLEQCRRAVVAIRPRIPIVALLPGVHRAPGYGYAHPGREPGERAMRRWAARVGAHTLDTAALIGAHVRGGASNPDGIHYGWSGHAALGAALGELLAELLTR